MSHGLGMHLGVDLSTTSVRCLLFDDEFELLGLGSAPHTGLSRAYEQDPLAWLDSFGQALARALAQTGRRASDISSVGIATQGVNCAAVSDGGEPLALPPEWVRMSLDESIEADRPYWYEKSGRVIFGPFLASRLLRAGHPDVSVRWALPGDFLAFHLTGEWAVGPGLASTTGLVDPARRSWSDELMNQVDLEPEQLSAIGEPTAPAELTAKGPFSRRFGLDPSAAVAFPTQDQRAVSLVSDPNGECCTVALGSAGAIVRTVDDGSMRRSFIPVAPGLGQDAWCLEGVVLTAGIAVDWAARILGCSSVSQMLRLAAEAPTSGATVRFSPGLAGVGTPDWDPTATASLHGLSVSDGREQIARAVVDGLCDLIAENIAAVGEGTEGVRMIGKLSLDPFVSRSMANRVGKDISVVEIEEPTATGAAIVGAHAAGQVDSLEEAVSALAHRRLLHVSPVGP